MKPTYTKLAADGSDLPATHPNEGPDRHRAVRVTRAEIPGWSLTVATDRAGDEVPFKKAQTLAEKHDAYGWHWRLPTVEELFLIVDRTDPSNKLDPNFFPDAVDYEYTWSSTVDARSPSDYAWGVYLGYGFSFRDYQSGGYLVRAVRAGQF